MNRNATAVALLLAGVMVLSSVWAIPAAKGIPATPPPPVPHRSAILIENFTGLEMQNLSLAPGGGVRLDYGDRVWGGDFKVDPDDDHQDRPSVAAGQNGRFFTAWEDRRLGPSDQNIYGQIFDKRGNRIGGEIAVCTAQNTQQSPDIASDANGSFLAAWEDQRDQSIQIYVKQFDSDGKMLKADAPVSTGSSFKAHPALASRPGAGYVLVWRDDRDGISQIYCRLLDGSGKPVSPEFSVSASQNSQDYPDIACDGQGRFVVVWASYDIGAQSIDGQRFDSAGNKAGTAVTITFGNYSLSTPNVAFDSAGNFITAWVDNRDSASSAYDIYAARSDPNGTIIGAEIAVVTDPKTQESPAIAVDGRDNFLISWMDSQLTDDRVGSRLFGPQGEIIGEVQYISAANHPYRFPSVCVDGGNNFIIVYHGYSNLANQIHCRPLLQTFKTRSQLVSEPYAPDKLVRWDTMSANFTLANPASNSLAFELTTDGGATWSAVPDNGSLAQAAGKALRVRAMLLTTDNLTSPTLRNMTLGYTWNTPPAVTAPAEVKVKKGREVTLSSSGSDPDLADAPTLGYSWNQTSGKALGLANLTSRNLSFKADTVGRFTFSVAASDGYATSPPASVRVVVSEEGKAETGIPLSAIILVVVVVIIVIALLAVMMMRKNPTTVIQYQPPPAPPAAPVQQAPPQTQPPVPPPNP
jgi:hypothetical protein